MIRFTTPSGNKSFEWEPSKELTENLMQQAAAVEKKPFETVMALLLAAAWVWTLNSDRIDDPDDELFPELAGILLDSIKRHIKRH